MKLSAAPLALLSAFGLKNEGRNPPEFGEAIVGVADVWDNYVANASTRPNSTIVVTAGTTAATSVNLSVPQGKAWRVLACHANHGVNAADAAILFYLAAGILLPATTVASTFYVAQTLGGPTTGRHWGTYLARPLFLPPGSAIQFNMMASAAPANNTTAAISCIVHEIDL